jgi:hypothetical protein
MYLPLSSTYTASAAPAPASQYRLCRRNLSSAAVGSTFGGGARRAPCGTQSHSAAHARRPFARHRPGSWRHPPCSARACRPALSTPAHLGGFGPGAARARTRGAPRGAVGRPRCGRHAATARGPRQAGHVIRQHGVVLHLHTGPRTRMLVVRKRARAQDAQRLLRGDVAAARWRARQRAAPPHLGAQARCGGGRGAVEEQVARQQRVQAGGLRAEEEGAARGAQPVGQRVQHLARAREHLAEVFRAGREALVSPCWNGGGVHVAHHSLTLHSRTRTRTCTLCSSLICLSSRLESRSEAAACLGRARWRRPGREPRICCRPAQPAVPPSAPAAALASASWGTCLCARGSAEATVWDVCGSLVPDKRVWCRRFAAADGDAAAHLPCVRLRRQPRPHLPLLGPRNNVAQREGQVAAVRGLQSNRRAGRSRCHQETVTTAGSTVPSGCRFNESMLLQALRGRTQGHSPCGTR